MPKIPKKIPPWIAQFIEFAKKHESNKSIHKSLDTFQQVINNRWGDFAQELEQDQKEVPHKKRKVDCVKAFGKALEKVADQAEEFSDNDVIMNEYLERLNKVVPEQAKPLFQELMGVNASPDVPAGFSDILEQTTKDLDVLATTTQNISDQAKTIDDGPLKKEAELAVQTIHKVSQSLNQLKSAVDSATAADGAPASDNGGGGVLETVIAV